MFPVLQTDFGYSYILHDVNVHNFKLPRGDIVLPNVCFKT